MFSPSGIHVIGAGPAGSAAALSALNQSVPVTIYEKTRFPRHKVCGEFLSPEAAAILDRLNLLAPFLHLQPHPVTRANVFLGSVNKRWVMNQPAFGISRYALDQFLLDSARSRGAELVREAAHPDPSSPTILASGRHHAAPGKDRLFGFKAHYAGPVSDSIDLLFDRHMYVGVNSIEDNLTNVCGLAPESTLRTHGFEPDSLLQSIPRLNERVRPLSRQMDWLITGPLVFGGTFRDPAPLIYPVGDALGFVDPFTGSGMLGALLTGWVGGRACATQVPSSDYLRQAKTLLQSQYGAASLFRKLVSWGVADKLAWLLPGQKLFNLTRPAVARAL
jgi:hypothetical protein